MHVAAFVYFQALAKFGGRERKMAAGDVGSGVERAQLLEVGLAHRENAFDHVLLAGKIDDSCVADKECRVGRNFCDAVCFRQLAELPRLHNRRIRHQ